LDFISLDFMKRVVAAVVTGGRSCNEAGKQFGVAVSTAVGWVQPQRETGSIAPGKMDGHRPKAISGKHRVWVLERIKAGDFTLRGLAAELAPKQRQTCRYFVAEFWGHSATLCPTSSYFSERAGPLPTRKQR